MSEGENKQRSRNASQKKGGEPKTQRQQSEGSARGDDNDKKLANNSRTTNSNNKKGGNGGGGKAKVLYPKHESYETCQEAYATYDTMIVRGKLRVLQSAQDAGSSFVTDDRGTYRKDILVPDGIARNRALDGDIVFVRLDEKPLVQAKQQQRVTGAAAAAQGEGDDDAGDEIVMDFYHEETTASSGERWQDDETQMALWNPVVSIERQRTPKMKSANDDMQRQGKVVYVHPPVPLMSEIDPTPVNQRTRALVGFIKLLPSGVGLLNPLNKSLPQFKVPSTYKPPQNTPLDKALFKAEYVYGSWEDTHKWPPCQNVAKMGESCVLEDEVQALLMQNQVDHGEFPSQVLRQVDEAVQSGLCYEGGSMQWKPTPDMYKGRRDYRKERIVTIDPTTAKDLDDALHIKELPNGRIEVVW